MAWEFGESVPRSSSSDQRHDEICLAQVTVLTSLLKKHNKEVSNSNPLMTDFNLIGGFDFDWENTVKSQLQI